MLNPDWDPYAALLALDQTQKQLIRAHNELAAKVLAQEEVIEVLIKGLDAANKANQELMTQSLDRFLNNMQTGQH